MPKLDSNNSGIKLALTGNIKLEILDNEELACSGINIMLKEGYSDIFIQSYGLTSEDLELDYYDILEKIGKKRGCIVSGGNVDMSRAANIFIDEVKNGKIGNVSLEKVGDFK